MFRKRLRKASMQRWQERGFRHASSRAGNHSVRMWQSDVRESAQSGLWVLQSFVSFMYFDNSKLCAITKTNIRPVKPNSLKLTQVAVGKLKATYTFCLFLLVF